MALSGPPRLMSVRPFELYTCFRRMGSRAGSNVSPTSWIRTGVPLRIACSRVRRYPVSVSLIVLRPNLASMREIHLWACPWGSIIMAQRLDLGVMQVVTMIAFSRDIWSVGRVMIAHSRICTGVARVLMKENGSMMTIPRSRHRSSHWFTISRRNGAVNAPRYAVQAADTKTSPASVRASSSICLTTWSHSTTLSARDPVRAEAAVRRLEDRSMLYSRSSFSLTLLSNVACSVASSASMPASLSLASLRVLFISSSLAWASARAAFFGATILDTRLYRSIARTHVHRDLQLFEPFFSMLSGVNSGSWIHFCSFVMTAGGMLSLS
mmetsp:Transcript_46775/g.83842  ORF Transcript_46775/g.83842 Transcript_46775/m.83842 type:complete len:324 (+) Transcript_46775:2992-3963(+)